MKTITRRLEIDAGHRLIGHESKCCNVHGHRYVFEVTVGAYKLDDIGRVVDFGVVKDVLGNWLDENWDHGFIYETGDQAGAEIEALGLKVYEIGCPPTAENIASIFHEVASERMAVYGLDVINVRVWETPNCYADSRGVQ